LAQRNKIYFSSDFHLGLAVDSNPLERERRVVAWLKDISVDAREIYLLGDIFDFWWEYKKVVPKGFTRFLGTISELTDSGISVHFFTGNHDMWIGNYLEKECGMITHTDPFILETDNKRFFLAHGHGLGTTDNGYKLLLKIFNNRPLRKLYSSLHPAIGVAIGHKWSLNSRLGKGVSVPFKGEEKEELVRFASSYPPEKKIDYFIFGHRHIPMAKKLPEGREMLVLGAWIKGGSFAVWDGKTLELRIIPIQSSC
jgi:UDP-2,3-diacylglucosamine hydrolase